MTKYRGIITIEIKVDVEANDEIAAEERIVEAMDSLDLGDNYYDGLCDIEKILEYDTVNDCYVKKNYDWTDASKE